MVQKAIDLVPEDWRSRFPETVSELGLLGERTLQVLLERWSQESEEAAIIQRIMEGNTSPTPPLIFLRPNDWLEKGCSVLWIKVNPKNGSMRIHGPIDIIELYYGKEGEVIAARMKSGETVLAHRVFHLYEIEVLKKHPLLLKVWLRGVSPQDRDRVKEAIEGFWLP